MKNVSCMFSANSGNNEMFLLKAEKGLFPWMKIFFSSFSDVENVDQLKGAERSLTEFGCYQVI